MKRIDAFHYYIDNILGILEILKSKIEKTSPEEKTIKKTLPAYIQKIKNSSSDIYEKTQETIIDLIKQIESQIIESYTDQQVREFIFVLASVSDELIVSSSIMSNENWFEYLIEKEMFATSISGEEIIKKISAHNRSHTNKDNEMSIIYYYILTIGYKGMYKNDMKKINELKQESLKVMSADYMLSSQNEINKIINNCYQFTVKTNKSNQYKDYNFIYKNILTFIIGIQIIWIIYQWFIAINFKLSKIN